MILAIVQARMSSTRLQGKVMRQVLGKPMIGYLLERLRLARRIDKIVLATSVAPENDPLCAHVTAMGFDIYRGSEEDVLDRFYRTAEQFGAEVIVRITGDCPLIDPPICDKAVEVYHEQMPDYVHTGPTFAEGLDCEVFSREALERAWRKAVLRSEREHATLYIYNHPESFRKITLANDVDDSQYRFTVDEEDDFSVVRAIIEHFEKREKIFFSVNEVKDFLNVHPEIFQLNRHIPRNEGLMKSLKEDRVIKNA